MGYSKGVDIKNLPVSDCSRWSSQQTLERNRLETTALKAILWHHHSCILQKNSQQHQLIQAYDAGEQGEDSISAQTVLHRQTSDQRYKLCLKSSPDIFFFTARIFVPTAAGKPDQLTDPKENKSSQTPQG